MATSATATIALVHAKNPVTWCAVVYPRYHFIARFRLARLASRARRQSRSRHHLASSARAFDAFARAARARLDVSTRPGVYASDRRRVDRSRALARRLGVSRARRRVALCR
jgi:hypothetical protein